MSANNRPGLLTAITAAFRDLNLDVGKAVVEGDEDRIRDKFFVQVGGTHGLVRQLQACASREVCIAWAAMHGHGQPCAMVPPPRTPVPQRLPPPHPPGNMEAQTEDGDKVEDEAQMSDIKRALEVLLRTRGGSSSTRPKFSSVSIQQDANKRELLYTLMGEQEPAAAAATAAAAAQEEGWQRQGRARNLHQQQQANSPLLVVPSSRQCHPSPAPPTPTDTHTHTRRHVPQE